MPMQIKKRSDAQAAEEQDLVYANSGLFSIEKEIENFAGKYSAYNKCFQSQMFLRRVIQTTEEEIEAKKVRKNAIRQNIKDKLEVDKKLLIERLENTSSDRQDEYVSEYPTFMHDHVALSDDTFSSENLNAMVADTIPL